MEPKFQTPGRAGSVGELAGNFGNLSCSDRSIVNISYPWTHGQVKLLPLKNHSCFNRNGNASFLKVPFPAN